MGPVNDEDVLQVLRSINDPEFGINIVDLGLVYRATRSSESFDIAITLTTPSCPLGEMLVEEAKDALQRRFSAQQAVCLRLSRSPDMR
jgi:metal-sulfur cluster biosynthetic enzyme